MKYVLLKKTKKHILLMDSTDIQDTGMCFMYSTYSVDESSIALQLNNEIYTCLINLNIILYYKFSLNTHKYQLYHLC